MSDHPIVHIELSAENPAESAQYYNKLFGWKLDSMPEMDYWSFLTEENHGGGFNRIGTSGGFETKPGDVIIYVHTEDLDGDLARAEELGGTVLKPRTDIPGMGWYAHFRDPGGNRVGLFQGIPMGEEQGEKQPQEQVATA